MTTDELRPGDVVTVHIEGFVSQYRVLMAVRYHSVVFGPWSFIQAKQRGAWSFDWFFVPSETLASFGFIANVKRGGRVLYARESNA